MVSSKPRSGSSEIAQKTLSSTYSKASSASKHNNGSPSSSEIDSKSSRLLERRLPKVTNLTEKRAMRGTEMQQQMSQLQEDLKKAQEQLAAVEKEKCQALDELREMKKVSEATSIKLSEALSVQAQAQKMSRVEELEQASIESAKKINQVHRELMVALKAKEAALSMAEEERNVGEANTKRIFNLSAELNSLKESLADSCGQLEIREKNIDFLKIELEKAKHVEAELAEKEALLEKLKQELSNTRESESRAMVLLSESKLRVQTLETELEKAKVSETEMIGSLLSQTKQLEQTNLLLEETMLEIGSLQKKVGSLEESVGESNRDLDASHCCLEKAKVDTHAIKETVENLESDLARAQDGEKLAFSTADILTGEMNLLKTELKLATEAEEKSKKAMDDLASVLIEVTTGTNEMKEKLSLAQSELENAREEAEGLKHMVKMTEEKNKGLLEEASKEIERVQCVAERLKLEAEDSILAWNEKELEFVNCIKRAEEESTASKHENGRLIESLREAEDMAKVMREENCKLRDILKQALNEASVAKEAAEIARAENSQLKDSLLDKDDKLQSMNQENEFLRINEAAALENVKELKRLLSTTSSMDTKAEYRDVGGAFKKQNPVAKEHKDKKKITEVLNLKFEELKISNGHKDEDEDPKKAEMFKGSIFDTVDSPELVPHHRKMSSSAFTDDGETINLDDFDHLDGTQLDYSENDKSSQRKKKALFRRFGDLLIKRGFNKRAPSVV